MAPAVLATVVRSGQVESVHRGVIAVADGDGRLVAAVGEVEQPFYFRSSAKPIQLLPTVERGVFERHGFGDREIAVAASSHSGAPRHVEVVRNILRQVGLEPEALGCGYQEPRNQESLEALIGGRAERTALYNNCSGKHAGMLALAADLGADPATYLEPDHPAQSLILDRTCELTGIARRSAHFGIDGCSAPTLYAPLAAFAAAFGRLARLARDGDGAGAGARRIGEAMAARPDMLGEPESFNPALIAALGRRLLAKGGAEGLFCGAVLDSGLGFAVRVEDGGSRAIGPVVIELLLQLELVRPEELGPLSRQRQPVLRNWRGRDVGTIHTSFVVTRVAARG